MASIDISASQDTFADATAATTNFDGNDNLDVGEISGGSNLRRSFIQFSLAAIPSGSTITSAILKIWDRGADGGTNTRTMRIFRLRRVWVANELTWNVYSTGNNWATAGADNTTTDREGTEIGSVSMPGVEVAGEIDITLTTSAVQEWLDGTFANNGVILKMDTETDDLHRLNSTEWGTPGERPILTVVYTPPSSGVTNFRSLLGVGF